MVTINWTLEATDDLLEIEEYLSRRSKGYAFLVINDIISETEVLENYPKIGRVVPEFELDFVREILYKNYRIVYHIIDKQRIDILTVHHSSKPLRK